MTRGVSAAHAGSVRIGDRSVHRMGLGTNRLTDTEACRALLRRAVELGVDFVDTADIYQSSASETTIGNTFGRDTRGALVATKGGMTRTPDGMGSDGRPEYLRQTVEASLRRLRTDRIELYQLHRVDPRVPIEASVGALKEMQEEGRIHRIGVSNVTVEELDRARRVATIVSVQNRYNLLEREQEKVLEVLRGSLDRVHSVDADRAGQARRSEDAHGSRGCARSDRTPACPALAPQAIPGDAADPRHDLGRSPRGEPVRGRHRAERRRVPAAEPVIAPDSIDRQEGAIRRPQGVGRRGLDPPSRPRGPTRVEAEGRSSRPPRRTRRRRTRAAGGPAC